MSRAFQQRAGKLAARITKIVALIIFVVLLVAAVLAQNYLVIKSSYIFESDKIPKTFVGYKIVQISDLRNDKIGQVERIISKAKPNIVIFTGNYVDNNGNYNNSVNLISRIAEKYNTVYVFGEMDKEYESNIENALNNTNAINIQNVCYNINAPDIKYEDYIKRYIEKKYIKEADEDPEGQAALYLQYTKESLEEDADAVIKLSGASIMEGNIDFKEHMYKFVSLDKEVFQLLVMNQGQLFKGVSEVDIDVVLAGNTFGMEQNGYKRGRYSLNNTTMFLSGGIGNNKENSFRIFNMPNIVEITLSDGTITDRNPLERLLDNLIADVGTRFDGDGGFKEYTYEYDGIHSKPK